MIPLVDIHCHLLSGIDDGPRTDRESLEMCRMECTEGVALASATAHQNDTWNQVTPNVIREATNRLSKMLQAESIPLSVYPCAEVMAHPKLKESLASQQVLTVADRGEYLLLEMPHGLFVDLNEIAANLCKVGVRPILAHAERSEELLHDAGRIDELIDTGCLVQVSTGSVTDPANRKDASALKNWFRRGVVHVMGSDGHSPRRRAPKMAAAYQQIARWAGTSVADRVCSTNGFAILNGLPLKINPPKPPRRNWLAVFS